MKRMGSSDSLSGLIPICPTEEDDFMVESGHVAEKKRRLSVDQVKALEKNFEVENKLEPERKVKLAQELGLQPRQVAVWFQNRRARWKTKQLERDYGVLEANYKTLKLNFESLQQDKESLLSELREVKSKLQEETKEKSGVSIKEESEVIPKCESEYIVSEQSKISLSITEPTIQDGINGASVFGDFKDGFSDSDSSAILNEEFTTTTTNNSPGAAISSSTASRSSSSINCFTFSDSTQKGFHHPHQHHHQQPFVRMEEHNFFSVEETCNFFSDDQAPSLQWCYSADQWS